MSTTSLYAQVPKEQAVEMQSLAVQVKETDACDSTKARRQEGYPWSITRIVADPKPQMSPVSSACPP